MAQHDAQHTSSTTLVGPTSGAARWVFGVTDQFSPSEAVDQNGTVYALGASTLYAIRADGSVAWDHRISRPAGSPALSADGAVLVPQRLSVSAFSPAGILEWNTTLGSPNLATGLTVSPDGTILAVSSSSVYALTSSGIIEWSLSTGCGLSAFSVGPDGTLYCGGREGNAGVLYALDPLGAILWKYITPAPIVASPVVAPNGTIYTADSSGNLFSLTPAGASAGTAWDKGIAMGFLVHAMALSGNGNVYVGGTHLKVLSATGTVVSDTTCYNNPAKALCVPYGRIFGISIDGSGTLYLATTAGNASSVVALGSGANSVWVYQAPYGEAISGTAAIGPSNSLYFSTSCTPCVAGQTQGHLYSVGVPAGYSPVTIGETGLPEGLLWNVALSGRVYLANENEMVVQKPSNSAYAWSAPLVNSTTSGTRFVPEVASGSLSVTSSGSLTIAYITQYEVEFGVSPFAGGNVSTAGGWFTKLSDIAISASPASGYAFGRWDTSSSSLLVSNDTSASSKLTVNGSGTVTGAFYPRVTVSASPGGSLKVLYGTSQASVSAGGSLNLYLPVSTRIVVVATPSQNYELLGWNSVPVTTGYGNLSVIVFPVAPVPSQITALFGTAVTTITTQTGTTTTSASTIHGSTTTGRSTGGGGLGLHLNWLEVAAGLAGILVVVAAAFWYRRSRRISPAASS